jgi:septal ring factor EnvC (AmiA/AmiB activator)
LRRLLDKPIRLIFLASFLSEAIHFDWKVERHVLNIELVTRWIEWLTVIGVAVLTVIRPIMNSFNKISENLTKMTHSLDLLNRDLQASKEDRTNIHDELQRHDERLDSHNDRLIEHSEKIKTLYKERG